MLHTLFSWIIINVFSTRYGAKITIGYPHHNCFMHGIARIVFLPSGLMLAMPVYLWSA
jgi:hypothetical protein